MKKFTRITALVLVMIMALVCAVSCSNEQDASGEMTIVIGGEKVTEYKVDLDKVEIKEGLISVLDYLKSENKLTYTANDSGYGAYLTSVGDVKEDSANSTYVYIWTSVEADFDTSAYATTMEYNGKTLTSSGVGASSMHIEDGAVVYIGTIKY